MPQSNSHIRDALAHDSSDGALPAAEKSEPRAKLQLTDAEREEGWQIVETPTGARFKVLRDKQLNRVLRGR